MLKLFLYFSLFIILISCNDPSAKKQEDKVNTEVVAPKKDSVVATDSGPSLESTITCPKCKFKKKEILPTDYCLLKYTCTNCKTDIFPDEKDCCVFCTYGDFKCPSKQ